MQQGRPLAVDGRLQAGGVIAAEGGHAGLGDRRLSGGGAGPIQAAEADQPAAAIHHRGGHPGAIPPGLGQGGIQQPLGIGQLQGKGRAHRLQPHTICISQR